MLVFSSPPQAAPEAAAEAFAVTMQAKGVTLHVDRAGESYYIQVEEGFDPESLRSLLRLAEDSFGLEPLEEWETPITEMPDGSRRQWLAEKEGSGL